VLQLLPGVYSKVWEHHLNERYTRSADKAWNNVFNFIVTLLQEGITSFLFVFYFGLFCFSHSLILIG
jgi:hypothetical protein